MLRLRRLFSLFTIESWGAEKVRAGPVWAIFNQPMINRLSERHIVALNYLLVTILAYFAALAANDIVLGRSPAEEPIARAAYRSSGRAPSHSRSDYQAIVDRDIFNLTPPPVVAPPPVVEDLHLTLIGVSRMSKGKPFAEETKTTTVNANGCLVSLDAPLMRGQQVSIVNSKTVEELTCNVAFISENKGSKSEVGLEFTESSPLFWRIGFPPEDWSESSERKRAPAPPLRKTSAEPQEKK